METIDCRADRHAVTRLRDGTWMDAHDDLAEEVPVALEYNGISHAVMLATPADLEEFALGFSLSEGLIASPQECHDITTSRSSAGITVHLAIGNAAFAQLKERRRNLAGRTGCGLCGTESLEHVLRSLPRLSRPAPPRPLSPSGIRRALAGLDALQPLNRMTGGTHAAAWCAPDGELRFVFEDVGRHNALDKLIGAMARSRADFADGFALITSRASVEMVQKAITVGMPALVAISAPTSLAVRVAREHGMTLVAFARGDDFAAYAHRANIRAE
ncbi:MAG TPA: formate dehydrogenase accessory sulfurtransferase FdhD [Noviherbaspirillum sp.]|uniref:formate dehydrogenase accessory sulfurtransferase FdhD n=1 Tax=Noviherbaspirillum sp. TaxID=1926288 RepID=UPI002B4830CC|nr:formate dehydrogenase accessory sulfurtransferase FdhD [Noviherbaspirillum sp.]HJV85235.1 formate dehydrogenase accessory sulfurtransferase FdhD [Noviherbaspirillum sp.]